MITLETGVPGAGKTLYCVDKLLRPMVGATVKTEDENGQTIEVPRRIFSNINGLLIDHEKIGPEELNTWHLWAKPGDLIVYDEIQKPWPKAATGSKVPDYIQALETHRHMGVDFIVLTQHPMLIHTNLVQLVGRHLHVRRMGNMSLAIVYEWDSCSKTLLYKNSLTKSPWRYSKEAQKLYKSAELHTKQPRKIPTLIYMVLIGILGMGVLAPDTFGRLKDRINGVQPHSNVVTTHTPAKPASAPIYPASRPGLPVYPAPPSSSPQAVAEQAPAKYAGCAAMRGVCRCYLDDSSPVEKPAEFCSATVGANLPAKLVDIPPSLQEYSPPPVLDKAHSYAVFKPSTFDNTVSLADVVAQYRHR